jgi:hypothetical protein
MGTQEALMSTQHTLTMKAVAPLPDDQLSMVKLRLDALLAEEAVQEAIDNSDFLTYDVDPDGVVLEFEDRWSRQGLVEVARRLSRGYLAAEVRVEISWDTRDNDESGTEAWVYRDGKLVSAGVTELVMAPVEPEPQLSIGQRLEQDDAFHDLPSPERARRRGMAILEAARGPFQAEGIPSFVIGDLLTDLIHLSTHLGIDFDATLERARERAADEVQNPEI